MSWTSHLGLIICCALSAVSITGTVSWLESRTEQLTANEALVQAKQTINHYCTRHQMNPKNFKLVDATAPSSWLNTNPGQTVWQFDFYSAKTGTIQVKIPESFRS